MEMDHIVMSSGCVCMAIKPGSTSVYMCKTHFLKQQDWGNWFWRIMGYRQNKVNKKINKWTKNLEKPLLLLITFSPTLTTHSMTPVILRHI